MNSDYFCKTFIVNATEFKPKNGKFYVSIFFQTFFKENNRRHLYGGKYQTQ